ncbi:MAG: radical SAM protein [Leptospiraceae bacterium]|nr:radical SAM protein [Leptospiraceae bacterium]
MKTELAQSLNLEDWQSWILPDAKYRAAQINHWVHKKNALSPDEMSDLPLAMRERLARDFEWPGESMLQSIRFSDADQTAKFSLAFEPNKKIETVWLPYENRQSLCVSVQSGCSLDCSFCATGKMKFTGNLSAGQILLQVYLARRRMNKDVTNIVFMGMGEPFYNYDNVMKAAHILHSDFGSGISTRRITVSTSGVLPGIERFVREKQPFKLALSLHSAIPEKRAKIMDIEKKFPMDDIVKFLYDNRNELKPNQLMIEYIMIKDFNMGSEDADSLFKVAKKLDAKINLIPLNTAFAGMERPSDSEIDTFWRSIRDRGIVIINRRSPAKDIDGACGMLALKESTGHNEPAA